MEVTREHLAGLEMALDSWNDGGPSVQFAAHLADLIAQAKAAPEPSWHHVRMGEPSRTQGMNLGERIAHVGGRENKDGYQEFGSVRAVANLINHVLRDLPARSPIVPKEAK